MKLLSLDVATHCGFCTRTASGCWDLSPKRDESKGMRLIRFKAKLKDICDVDDINLVTFERVVGHHKNALIVEAELVGVLKVFCEENKIEYRAYSPSELKKYATGNGNANKKKMVEYAKLKYGMVGDDDNEADAIHLYHLTIEDLKL